MYDLETEARNAYQNKFARGHAERKAQQLRKEEEARRVRDKVLEFYSPYLPVGFLFACERYQLQTREPMTFEIWVNGAPITVSRQDEVCARIQRDGRDVDFPVYEEMALVLLEVIGGSFPARMNLAPNH